MRDLTERQNKTRAKSHVQDAIGRAQQAVETQASEQAEQVREDIADSRIDQQEQMRSINKKNGGHEK